MDSYRIYNKSSEDMSEVASASCDLIVTSPPYNIGTTYGTNPDTLKHDVYKKLLRDVVSECSRILRPEGRLIFECADSILTNGTYMQLAAYVQSLCIQEGFVLQTRHINFVASKEGVELPENKTWTPEYETRGNNHSNCHQIMVFSKDPHTTFDSKGETLYVNYVSEQGHPCPIPPDLRTFLLDRYFKEGMCVADPFMGTGMIGVEVVKRKGTFIGYELDSSIFAVARKNFEK